MKFYVEQAVTFYGDSLEVLVLTGGECFLLKDDLAKIIEYGSSKGLITRVVTNGYWANSYERAHQILLNLRNCGLQEINFSTGDDHQKWVPYDKIVNGCCVSMDLGLTCLVNVEYHDKSQFKSNTLLNDSRLIEYFDVTKYKKQLRIDQGVWIPFDRNTSVSYDCAPIQNDFKRCISLFSTLPINPYSWLMSCCGLTSEYIKPLRLGRLDKDSNIKSLYETQFVDFIKIWLFTEGPHAVLTCIYNKRNIDKPVSGHNCYVCAEIFKDINNILWIREHYNEIMPTIMLKYILLKRSLT
jgi:MoaA/NifB/PqqE/SkfB family radical SAM enzyme